MFLAESPLTNSPNAAITPIIETTMFKSQSRIISVFVGSRVSNIFKTADIRSNAIPNENIIAPKEAIFLAPPFALIFPMAQVKPVRITEIASKAPTAFHNLPYLAAKAIKVTEAANMPIAIAMSLIALALRFFW